MKKINIIALILMIATTLSGIAQEYKLAISNGTLKFREVHKLTIESTSGNEVIFTSSGGGSIPERAQGLRPINSLGVQDNTGIGLSIIKEGSNTHIVSYVMRNSGRYTVKVPKGVKVMIEQNSIHGSKVEVNNISNDVEISTRYSAVHLTNFSGSALINTVHGGVNAEFATLTPGKPVSIISAHGHVDVTLPTGAKANIKLNSAWGDIFTDMDIQFASGSGEMRQVTSAVEGKINGGGTEVYLESTHSNIYLRKK